jgi:transcriptional regulator with XRE-family HTH domain
MHVVPMNAKEPPESEDARRVDERRAALRSFMERSGLKAKTWAESAGVSPNTLYNYLNGLSHSLRQDTLEKLASSAEVTISEMFGEHKPARAHVRYIKIIGAAMAGYFQSDWKWPDNAYLKISLPNMNFDLTLPTIGELRRRAENDPSSSNFLEMVLAILPEEKRSSVSDNEPVTMRSRLPESAFGLLFYDSSAEKFYPGRNVVLICVPLPELGRELKKGDRVVVARRTAQGVETVIRQFDVDPEGNAWLWPGSSLPQYQQPIPLRRTAGGDYVGDDIEIKAVVRSAISEENT